MRCTWTSLVAEGLKRSSWLCPGWSMPNNYRLYEALFAACGPGTPLARVVLDVAGARFGDFAVTGLLRRLSERTATAGARLELRGATGELVAMLGSCGLRADITLS